MVSNFLPATTLIFEKVCYRLLNLIFIKHLVTACIASDLECPLKKDVVYKYEASFPILKIYPRVDVVVKYELKNSEGKDIICVKIPVKIQ